jgi:hypothetical protein
MRDLARAVATLVVSVWLSPPGQFIVPRSRPDQATSAPCTTTTANATFSTVNTAIGAAARNDVICLPAAGSSGSPIDWGASGVTITKGLTIRGAGRDSTFITSTGTMFSITPDATAIANEERIEIDKLTLDGGNSSSSFVHVSGAGSSASKPFKKFVLGNSRLRNGTTVTSNAGVVVIDGQVRGVVYNNLFDRVNVLAKVLGNNNTAEFTNAAYYPPTFGTDDSLYFEDDTISYSSNMGGGDPGWVESGQGMRLVMRYNAWDMTNQTTTAEVWDIHGFQHWVSGSGGETGTMVVEYYGNTGTDMRQYRWVNHRGGWGLYFDNVFAGTGGLSIEQNQMGAGSSSPSGCSADVPGTFTTEIDNTYVFNNTKNGTVVNMSGGSGGGDYCGITENANYWNYNAGCTTSACATGVGRGTTAPTGTCTTGVGFWVASTATPTTSSSVIQAASLYKCTSTNTWTLYYTPYTYPHPLRSS